MQIIRELKDLPSYQRGTGVAIGNFDGVHLGHQKILKFLSKKTCSTGLSPIVLTFFPHPEKILGKNRIQMIQTLDQRLTEIRKYNIEEVIILDFNKDFSRLPSQDFIKDVVVNPINAKLIFVGENFRFGKNRMGDVSTLNNFASKFNYDIYKIPSILKNKKVISSSLIRDLLLMGKVEESNELLGRPYEIDGVVIKGKSRGNKLGFPTANIKTENEISPPGVFLTNVRIGTKNFPSLTNIGNCPTFDQKEVNIESYIINFKSDLYEKNINIQFLKKIREEKKFDSPEKLSGQIKKDLELAKDYFNFVTP